MAIYFLKNPEKFEKLSAMIWGLFSNIFHKAELKHISNDLQSDINTSIKQLNNEAGELILPFGLNIKWTKSITPEAFIDKDDIIVRMDYHKNKQRNLVVASMNYVSKGLIPYSRPYIGSDIAHSVDLVLAKKMLKNHKDAISYFIREIIDQEPEEIINLYNKLDELDEKGLLTRIFLTELRQIGIRFFPKVKRDHKIISEIKGFINFLIEIATKKTGEDVPLTFRGEVICLGIILVANIHLYKSKGVESYRKRIIKYVNDEIIKRIYVLAAGGLFIKATEQLYEEIIEMDQIEEHRKSKFTMKNYKGRKTEKGICLVLDKK